MPKKRAVVGPSPLGSYLSGTDKASARHRYMGLLQDYQDLVKEIDTRKLGLLKANQKKFKLVAEVKFLRKKLKSFLVDDSLKMTHRLEKLPYIPALSSVMHSSGLPSQAHQEDRNHKETAAVDLNQVSYKPAPPSARYVQLHNSGPPSKAHLEASNHKVREAAILGRGSTALLDLNHVSYRLAPPSARYAQMPNPGLLSKAHLEDRNQKVTNVASRSTTTILDLNEAQICTTDMPRYAQQPQLSAPSARNAQMHNADLASKAHPEERNHEVTEAASRRTAALLDLNQYVEEFEQEPFKIDNLKRFSVGSNVATMNDHKLFCRGSGNEPKQVSQRKISLQDQLPLRV